ncbi:hypothetical protein FEM03_14025 [Phragmitibacter flavus]|uniref:Type II secretion system protein GspC N-terminal domain-containing protein n=1 Tax=Phragmitibacter flavus TaxID=2576071 RepID=A0A5R8KDB6_9BACT|nr:hypothetical protein [Phragmitibacter flavus]TLD70298.1 hypothetical protein FEM03_14025 [Phragmitibacter flavus]
MKPFIIILLSFSLYPLAFPQDPDLPQPFNPAMAEPPLASPPFTRSVNLSDKLVLTGIAFIEGKPVATILDTEKKQSYVLSEEPNAEGWKLAETSATIQLDRTQAKIMVGGEIVTVRYSKTQLTPENTKGARPGGEGDRGRGDRGDRGDRRESRRGPDPETRARFEALPEDARRKLFEEMRENRDRLQGMSDTERSDYFKRQLERAERRARE